MSGWATVIVGHFREHVAERVLDSQGFDVYVPRHNRIVRGARFLENGKRVRSRTDTIASRPLFVGYVFVHLDAGQQWSPISQTIHVQRIITTVDHQPVLLRDDVIEQLKADEAAGIWNEDRLHNAPHGEMRKLLVEGGKPLVTVSSLGGITGQLMHLDDKGRARVLLEQMLGSVVLTVDGKALQLVEAA